MLLDDAVEKGNESETQTTSETPKAKAETQEKRETPTTTDEKKKTAELYRLWESREGRKYAELQKALDAREESIKRQETDTLKRIRDTELEAVKDDKEALDAVMEKHRRQDAEYRAQHAEERAKAVETERNREKIEVLAEKAGVELDTLLDLSDGNYEKAKKLAPMLSGKKAEPKSEEKPGVPVPYSDSGVTKGGSDNMGDLPPKERAKVADRAIREGKK